MNQIYFDPVLQCLWSENWDKPVPIEEIGVSRDNDYVNKQIP